MSNKRHKDIKPGFGGINFKSSRNFEEMPQWKPKHKKDSSDLKKINENPTLDFKLNIDAIETIDDIKLILDHMDLIIHIKDEGTYDKLEHLLKIHNRVFNDKREMTSCSSCVKELINTMQKLYTEYEEETT